MAAIDQVSLGETTYELVPEIAPLFDNTKEYAIGDYVIKDAALYKFKAAHAAGAWVGTDAEVITVGNELTDLKADLSESHNSGILPYDEFYKHSSRMENYDLKSESAPITDMTNWNANNVRLETRFSFTFSSNKIIRCDSDYKFKIIEVNPTTNIIVSWPSVWYTSFELVAGKYYMASLAHSNTQQRIYPYEACHLYIDALGQHIDSIDKALNYQKDDIMLHHDLINRNIQNIGKGNVPIDYMSRYCNSIGLYESMASVGDSIYSDSSWSRNNSRLSIVKELLLFDTDIIIRSDSDDYLFKMNECDESGNILANESLWHTYFCARAGHYYSFTMKKDSSPYTMNIIDFNHITACVLADDFNAHTNFLKEIDKFISFKSKFINSGIDYDTIHENKLTFSYTSTGIRRSCFFIVDTPILLSMRSPLYVFRFYWYDTNNTYHETAWGTLWKTPINVEVGMSIKRRDDGQFAIDERPEQYLEVWRSDEEPKSYFIDEINDTVEKVNAAFTEPGLCFFLSTDHHTKGTQNTGSLVKFDTISDMVTNMKAVADKIHFDGNIVLGDLTDMKVGSSADFAKYGITNMDYQNLDSIFHEWIEESIEQIQSVHENFYYTPGNHDDNRYINSDKIKASESAYDYTPGQVFSYYIAKGNHNVIYNIDNNGLDFYVNYDQFKIRMFFIDSNYYNLDSSVSDYTYTKAWWYGYADSTVTWLQNQLALVPNDWSVIICSHMSPIKEHNEDNVNYLNFINVKNVIQSFVNNGGNYIATIYGHTHGDWSATEPWLEFGVACQKCENYNSTIANMPGIIFPTRTAGTYTEDCWNVVLILPKSRKIKVIRFGAGDDKEYSY